VRRLLDLIRGGLIGSVFGALVFAVVIAIGIAPGGSVWVFAAATAGGLVVSLIPSSSIAANVTGAILAGLAGVALGVGTGFGWLEVSLILGALGSVVWLIRDEWVPAGHWVWFVNGGLVILFLLFVLVPLIIGGGALGHDEAAYALKAKEWLLGTPGTGWAPHRGTAMSAFGYLVLALGGSEPGLRLVGLLGAIGLVVGLWILTKQMAGPRAAAMASIGVVAGPALLRRSTEYLSDVPAAALLVWCVVVVWAEFGARDLPSYRLLWLLPPALLAFYLRYQSILSFGVVALTALLLWSTKIKRRPGPVLALGLMGLIGLIPHFIQAVELRGSPWGILTFTAEVAGRAYLGEGLVDYTRMALWPLAGLIGPVCILAALVGLGRSRRGSESRARYLFLLLPALAQLLILGVLSHGEARFVFFPIALIVGAGAMALEETIWGRPTLAPLNVSMALLVLIAGSLSLSAASARHVVDHRVASNESIELAGLVVSREAGEESCAVMTSYTPQMTYYSECSSDIFRPDISPTDAVDRLVGDSKYMVLVEGGKRQPTGDDLAGLLTLTEPDPEVVDADLVDAEVYRFRD
jgi:hypothetical protein